jgi:diguanylate cyclase (GGDEF)-like protein
MTRAFVALADPEAAELVRQVLVEEVGVPPVMVADHADPSADIGPGDWIVVDSSRRGVNGFEVALRARALKADRIFLVLPDGETQGELLARFCKVSGVIRGPLTKAALAAMFAERPGRVGVDQLLREAESRVGEDREQFARRVLKGVSSSTLSDLGVFLSDPQTGLFNRSFTSFKLDEEFKRAVRFQMPLSVILIEFEGVDHACEPTMIPEVASVFLNECRDIDTVGRIGVQEFLLLLPGTDAGGCRVLGERLLAELTRLVQQRWPECAPAIGLATYPRAGLKHRDDLLALAQQALSGAKALAGARLKQA